MPDPVSWLLIDQGWRVVGSDGAAAGTVAQVEGDKSSDIFDGLAVEPAGGGGLRYVPAEQVGPIYPGEVTLTIAGADLDGLEPFRAPPPETTWRPEKPSFTTRIANWFRGLGS